jgi:hypothetical protein
MSLPPLPESPLLVAVLAMVGFAAFWGGISRLIAAVSGWQLLGQFYRLTMPFNGRQWRFRSGRMRWATNYNGCLTLGANARGLDLAVMWPFRLGHPPLFIPWSEVQTSVLGGLASSDAEWRFRRAPGVRLRVSQRLARELLQAGGRS